MPSSKSYRSNVIRLLLVAIVALFIAINWMFASYAAVLTPTGATLSCTEGTACSGTVATFTSNDPTPQLASNYSATITWGDGTPASTGTVTSNGSGGFSVSASHTYSEEGTFQISVVIKDAVDNTQVTVNSTAGVADAPLSQFSPASPGLPTTFTGVGTGGSTTALNSFRAAIGGVNNGGNPPPQSSGRREINWDAVKLDGTDFGGDTTVISLGHTVGISTRRFQARGALFDQVYTVSGDGFASVNPNVSGLFPAFSPNNTFAPFNDNTIDMSFVLASSPTTPPVPAVVSGFGAIFVNVQLPNTSSIEYFSGPNSLGKFFVPPAGSSGQPEFLGVIFNSPVVTNVRLTLGTAQIYNFDGTTFSSSTVNNPASGANLVATDDFVYSEPLPLPQTVVNATAATSFTTVAGTFFDTDPNGNARDFTATIDWGDGHASAGTITAGASGGFNVTGTNTYANPGTYQITVVVQDFAGSSVTLHSKAVIGFANVTPAISINDVAVTDQTSGPTNAAFTVSLSAPTSSTVTVNFATADGTATSGTDYVANAGTLTFNPGETTKLITVVINPDNLPEPNKVFFVNLTGPSNATLGKAQGVGTILNDDLAGALQFSSPTYTVNEVDGSVQITVTRSGGSAGPASVDFATADGTATQRSDYTIASGTLTFAAGETSKTFTVLVNDDAFVEGNGTVNLTLSNASGATLGTPGTAILTITDNETVPPTTNPLDDAQFFVRQHYHDFLNREPDPAGLSYWTNQITSCGSDNSCLNRRRVGVSAAFFTSTEFQDTGFFPYRIFKAAFGAQPNYLRFMRDRGQIAAGPNIDASKAAFANAFITRAEFVAQYPNTLTPAQYVDLLNNNAGGVLTQAERDALVSGLTNGTETRGTVLRKVADNAVFVQRETNPAFVLMQYYGYLRRDVDPGGYNFWLNVLNATGNPNGMVCAFITSQEYQQRFGSLATHSNSECGK